MNTEKLEQKDKDNFKEEIKQRLRWYTFEAPEEEINEKEIEALVKLLQVLDKEEKPMDGQAAYERFKEYKTAWETDEARLSHLPLEKTEPEGSARTEKKKPLLHKRKMASTAVAAVIMAAVFAVGGTVGVHAEKNGGFFHWLKKDETGVTMITSPQNVNVGTDTSNTSTYNSLKDVPTEYQKYVIGPEDLESLKEFELQGIETIKMDSFSEVCSKLICSSGENSLTIGAVIYTESIFISRQMYLNYNFLDSFENENVQLDIFSKESENDKIEYVVCFYYGNVQYFVQGEYELHFMEELAKEYMDSVIM